MRTKTLKQMIPLIMFLIVINIGLSEDFSTCRNLNESKIYTLTTNIWSTGTCINITADDVTLDCNNWNNDINFRAVIPNSTIEYYGIRVTGNRATIKNCAIWTFGGAGADIYLDNVVDTKIQNVAINLLGTNLSDGIVIKNSRNTKINDSEFWFNGNYSNSGLVLSDYGSHDTSLKNVVFASTTLGSSSQRFTELEITTNGLIGTTFVDTDINTYSLPTEGAILSFKSSLIGELTFLEPVSGSGVHLKDGDTTSIINMSTNNISVKSNLRPGFNKSANITIKNTDAYGFSKKIVYRDGGICPNNICRTINAGNDYLFNVTSFSSYAIGDAIVCVDSGPIKICNVYGCGELKYSPGTYTLMNDIATEGTCFTVTANSILLNLNNHQITGNGSGQGVKINGHTNIFVSSGTVSFFETGIETASTSGTIQSLTVKNNNYGINVTNSNVTIDRIILTNNSLGLFVQNSPNINISNVNAYNNSNDFAQSFIVDWLTDQVFTYFNNSVALQIESSQGVNLTNVTVVSQKTGILIKDSPSVTLTKLFVNENELYGLSLINSPTSTLSNSAVRMTSNTLNSMSKGFYVYNSDNTTITDISATISLNIASGLHLENGVNITAMNLSFREPTSLNTTGLYLKDVRSSNFKNIYANTGSGITLNTSDINIFENVSLTNNPLWGLHLKESNYNTFIGGGIYYPLQMGILLNGNSNNDPEVAGSGNKFINFTIAKDTSSFTPIDIKFINTPYGINSLYLIDTLIAKYDFNSTSTSKGKIFINNTRYGEVRFTQNIQGTGGLHLNDGNNTAAISIVQNKAIIRATQNQGFASKTANISLVNTPSFVKRILMNGVECNSNVCNNLIIASNYVFFTITGVTQDTTFEADTNLSAPRVESLPRYVSNNTLEVIGATYSQYDTNVTIKVAGQNYLQNFTNFLDINNSVNNLNTTYLFATGTTGTNIILIPKSDENKISAGLWIEFDNYPRKNFEGYEVNSVDASDLQYVQLNLSSTLERTLPIGTNITIRNQSYPQGWFNKTIRLFFGFNNVSVYYMIEGYNSTANITANIYYTNVSPVINVTNYYNYINQMQKNITFTINDSLGLDLINWSTIYVVQNKTNSTNLTIYITRNTTINLSGQYTNFSVSIQNISCTRMSNSSINCSVNLNLSLPTNTSDRSTNDLTIYAANFANLNDTETFRIIYDPSAPNLSMIRVLVPSGITTSRVLTANWTATTNFSIIEPQSEFDYFEIAVEHKGTNSIIMDWTNVSNYTNYTTPLLMLTPGQEYRFLLRAKNKAGSTSNNTMSEYITYVDNTAPIITSLTYPRNYTNDRYHFDASWFSYDNESGVAEYEVQVSKIPYPSPGWSDPENVVWIETFDSSVTTASLGPFTSTLLQHNTYYYLNIKARNTMIPGIWSDFISTNNSYVSNNISDARVLYDATPPENGSISYETHVDENNQTIISVNPGYDYESGITNYRVWMAKAVFTGNTCQWGTPIIYEETVYEHNYSGINKNPGNDSFYQTLENGYCYRFYLESDNHAGSASTWYAYNETETNVTIILDNSPPLPFNAYDYGAVTYDGTKISAYWDQAVDQESGITGYAVWIEETWAGNLHHFWPTNGSNNLTYNTSDMNITVYINLNNSNESQPQNQYKYYFHVVAINGMGNVTEAITDGIYYLDVYAPITQLLNVEGDNQTPYLDTNADGITRINISGEEGMRCIWSRADITYRDADNAVAFDCINNLPGNTSLCNVTNQIQGFNRVHVSCVDKNGIKQTYSQNLDVEFYADTLAPNITLTTPNATNYTKGVAYINGTVKYNGTISLKYNITDSSLDKVWYVIQNSTYDNLTKQNLNVISETIAELTINLGLGVNRLENLTLIVFANDTQNLNSNASFSFVYDSTTPKLYTNIDTSYNDTFMFDIITNNASKTEFTIIFNGTNLYYNQTNTSFITGYYNWTQTISTTGWNDTAYEYLIKTTNDFNNTVIINSSFYYDANTPMITVTYPNETDIADGVVVNEEGVIFRSDIITIPVNATDGTLDSVYYTITNELDEVIQQENLTTRFVTTNTNISSSSYLSVTSNATINKNGTMSLRIRNIGLTNLTINSSTLDGLFFNMPNLNTVNPLTPNTETELIITHNFSNNYGISTNITVYYRTQSEPNIPRNIYGKIEAKTIPENNHQITFNAANLSYDYELETPIPYQIFTLDVNAIDRFQNTAQNMTNFIYDITIPELYIDNPQTAVIEDFAFDIFGYSIKNMSYEMILVEVFNDSLTNNLGNIVNNVKYDYPSVYDYLETPVVNVTNFIEGRYTIEGIAMNNFLDTNYAYNDFYYIKPIDMNMNAMPNPVNNTKSTTITLTVDTSMISQPNRTVLGYWINNKSVENYHETAAYFNQTNNKSIITLDHNVLINAKNITYRWIVFNQSGRPFASKTRVINVTESAYKQTLNIDASENITFNYYSNLDGHLYNTYTGNQSTVNMSLSESETYNLTIKNTDNKITIDLKNYNLNFNPNSTIKNLDFFAKQLNTTDPSDLNISLLNTNTTNYTAIYAYALSVDAENFSGNYNLIMNYTQTGLNENNLILFKMSYAGYTVSYSNYTNSTNINTTTNTASTTMNGLTAYVLAQATIAVPQAPEPTCSDTVQNQGETGTDCGGPCSACQTPPPPGNNGRGTSGGSTTVSSSSFFGFTVIKPTCYDNKKNQNETGKDCGGPCGGYWYDDSCHTFPRASCDDGIKNQNEEGIDCGGTCVIKCPEPEKPVVIANCYDNIQNQNEIAPDCGGVCGGYWYDNLCNPQAKPETCFDGLLNQNEEGADCGGVCEECKKEPQPISIGTTLPFMIIGVLVSVGLLAYVFLTRNKESQNIPLGAGLVLEESEGINTDPGFEIGTPIAVEEQPNNIRPIDAENSDVKELLAYINSEQTRGKTSYDIKKALLMAGWPISMITQAFDLTEHSKKIKELEMFILKAKQNGISERAIKKSLLEANWSEHFVEILLHGLHKPGVNPENIKLYADKMVNSGNYRKDDIVKQLTELGWEEKAIYQAMEADEE